MTTPDPTARHRGLCIYFLRLYLRERNDYADARWRRVYRRNARDQIAQLRELGPGRVEQPEMTRGGVLGPALEWWGKR